MEPRSHRQRRVSRFRKRESDRSGFNYKQIEMVRDKGALVGSDEFDAPPPNIKPIGGEGDISPGFTNPFYTSFTSNQVQVTTQFVTAAGGINFVTGFDEAGDVNPIDQWVLVAGSNGTVNITANPQITAGQQNNQFTVQCVGSSVILENGSGLSMPRPFTMTSGDIINFFYSQTDNLWHETSRGNQFGFLADL